MYRGLLSLLAALAALSSVSSTRQAPLDVGGSFDEVSASKCFDWGHTNGTCVLEGCTYTPQVVLTTPDAKGVLNYTVQGSDTSCWKGKMGPFPMSVDQCGRILGGAGGTGEKWWEHIQTFDPEALDQEMDVMVLGNVLGFNSNPAGFQHSVIMQQNITICSGHEMDTDTCAPGHERLVCIDKFAHCTGGDCANKNLDLLSPRNDAFFSRLTTTGLHGDYDLVKATSSAKCPVNMTVHQFGTQLGLGIMGKDLHMTRLVDRSMAGEDASCVQFYSVCSGLQFHFEEGFVGRFLREDDKYSMEVFQIRPSAGSQLLELNKCILAARNPAPQIVEEYVNQHPVVVLLSILLVFVSLVAAGLLSCCLTYRQQIIAVKTQQAYDIFQNDV
mmetsp:Transcript_32326/g.76804  ORF Transcript_32326/g.76804 Transcript_32326/m.76804 type:complete len:385 (+) Transcript_32326:42-1196(+)